MATTIKTFNIAANADDGKAVALGTVTSIDNGVDYVRLYDNTFNDNRSRGWLRFTGITIPKETFITSATLKVYATYVQYYMYPAIMSIDAFLDTRQSPGNPTTESLLTYNVEFAGFASLNSLDSGDPGVKDDYGLQEINVRVVVQNLINDYDYDDGEMVFYTKSYPNNFNSNFIALYNRDWGTTKSAELVIEYEVD